jgi:hypothetical protein
LLGVILIDNFSFDNHVNSILATCSQRFYLGLLKLLRDGGMPVDKLNFVFFVLLLSIALHTVCQHGEGF